MTTITGIKEDKNVNRLTKTHAHTWFFFPVYLSQVALVVKSPLASAGDRRDAGSIPGLERSPGEGSGRILKPTPVFLHGESYGQRSLAGYTVHGVPKSWTWLKWLSMQRPWDVIKELEGTELNKVLEGGSTKNNMPSWVIYSSIKTKKSWS